MKFQSKKDSSIIAELVEQNEKYGTVMLQYLSGDNEGKTVSITTATLHRWWNSYVENDDVLSSLQIDEAQVNTTYPEPKVQKYVKKPASVIRYEELKLRVNRDLPTYSEIKDELQMYCNKVNDTSAYIKFTDGSTLWRKSKYIDIYATEMLWEKFTFAGLTSTKNKDKARPFAFRIKKSEEYQCATEVIKECMKH